MDCSILLPSGVFNDWRSQELHCCVYLPCSDSSPRNLKVQLHDVRTVWRVYRRLQSKCPDIQCRKFHWTNQGWVCGLRQPAPWLYYDVLRMVEGAKSSVGCGCAVDTHHRWLAGLRIQPSLSLSVKNQQQWLKACLKPLHVVLCCKGLPLSPLSPPTGSLSLSLSIDFSLLNMIFIDIHLSILSISVYKFLLLDFTRLSEAGHQRGVTTWVNLDSHSKWM